jgi:uncharacterized protein YndB with AHSA1/START domain
VVGPEHFTTPRDTIEFDLRPGGVCRLTMVGPDGERYPSDGHFGIVRPPERLSFGEQMTDHPMIESGETTVEFIDLGENRTKVVVTSRMICAEELVAMARAGWAASSTSSKPCSRVEPEGERRRALSAWLIGGAA